MHVVPACCCANNPANIDAHGKVFVTTAHETDHHPPIRVLPQVASLPVMTFVGSIPVVTVFLVIIYSLLFSFVLVTDQVPSIPPNTPGLDLGQGFYDLHQVRI